ncbi:hypothetical protein JAAARDRAFT_29311 [Jaapia argillacea MUCL 33604]|uniref:protein-ribulosamine 3-kinase n=1 Tax=Jaapia argillacea MUCL 33604 TaxID=933084 RepID=A0A067Q8B9_9AGAM|nr:hypothetical protein JAAARDRAFT_29311 [Jaapia argillacea MUCL 33604]
MKGSDIPDVLLKHLRKIEPDAEFSGSLPRIESSSGKRYFAKIGRPSETEQYIGEAESLRAMDIGAPGLAPNVFAFGVSDNHGNDVDYSQGGHPYFLSEYKDIGSLTEKAAKALGKRLALDLHGFKSMEGFGFGVPTYCGATRQENGWFPSWEECFDSLIGGLFEGLRRKGRYAELCAKGEKVRERVIPYLLRPLVIQPVLLHGDLWSGNAGVDRGTGEPVIFDPSSYYGHNEADLAIARIFGVFPRSFFTTYHLYMPKSDPVEQYDLRGDLYELYHYLNHTLLFGGGYAGSAMSKMDSLLRGCE